jgi:hypothetical protein
MEAKLANCEITLQAVWPIVKSHTQSGVPKATSAIHGPLRSILYAIDKANIIADCLENLFWPQDFCDCDHRRHVMDQVEALLDIADEGTPADLRPTDVSE